MMQQSPSIPSSDTSSASSVLINATTLPQPNEALNKTQHDTSGSSFSSTNSHKVRIKAKYLKEIKSPFDGDNVTVGKHSEHPASHVPPALPANRPPGYDVRESTVKQSLQHHHHHHHHHGTKEKQHKQRTEGTFGIPESPTADKDNSASSALMEAINTSGNTGKHPANITQAPTTFKTPSSSSSSGVVKQGAPISGNSIPSQLASNNGGNNLRITQFVPTGRQRIIKEQLLKRQENSAPVKRFVQPKMVTSQQQPKQDSLKQPDNNTVTNTTSVAAATAAAVAATAPIVKAQSDLEYKMNAIMDKLSSMNDTSQQQPHPHTGAADNYGQVHELQNRLDEVTQLRLKQLERMQEQQMEWQVQMFSASHPSSSNHPSVIQQIPQVPKSSVQHSTILPSVNGQPQSTIGNAITGTPVSQRSSIQRPNQRCVLPHGQSSSPIGEVTPGVLRRSGHHHRTLQSNPMSGHKRQSGESNPQHTNRSSSTSKRNTKQHPIRKHVKYAPAVTLHGRQSPLASGTLVDGEWKEKMMVGMEHGTQTSPLDTPAPRRHPPVPLSQDPPRMSHLGRGLLEEILTSHDEEERVNQARINLHKGNRVSPHRNTTTVLGGDTHQLITNGSNPGDLSTKSTATRQADGIVRELGDIRSGVDIAIRNAQHQSSPPSINSHHHVTDKPTTTIPSYHEQLLQDTEREMALRRTKTLSEPAPLDDYLRKPPPAVEFSSPPSASPSNRLPLSPSQYNAPVPLSSCAGAEALLKQVQANKVFLETNLDIVARATTEKELYNLVENLYQDEHASEKARIRKEVDNRIASIHHEIQQELVLLKAAGSHSNLGPARLPAEKDSRSSKIKADGWRAGKKKNVQAKINTGLKRGQKIEDGDEKMEPGKENLPEKRPMTTTKSKRQPSNLHNRDEQYITRVYGKAAYQAQRSTLKMAPYLKYSTTHTPKTNQQNRPAPVVHTKGVEVKSSKSQTLETSKISRIPTSSNQYFFEPYAASTSPQQPHPTLATNQHSPSHHIQSVGPTHGQLIPTAGPTHGQLIPMAVPLGEPRTGGGLPVTMTTTRPTDKDIPHSSPRGSPRQKTTNVAVVNVVAERKPNLQVQHLPNVDIDTAPPTPAPSEDSVVHPPVIDETLSPPPQDRPNSALDKNSRFSNYIDVADRIEESSSSEDELPIPGISLPGYRERPHADYHGPVFPPKAPAPDYPSSDILASGIRRKELLQNQAVDWVEQELMARMISEMTTRQQTMPRPQTRDPLESADSSMVSSTSSQPSMVDAYGSAGLQLFVDAGQPVNPELVNALVREALEEKIASMLGQHQREPRTPGPINVDPQPEPSQETPIPRGSPLSTPEVTPKASPLHTPPSAVSPLATPPASIAESSVSEPDSLKDTMPIPETPVKATPEPFQVPSSPVTTPAATPPPTPPKAPTPELSPRASPIPLILNETDLPTPSLTPEPVSPEPVEEEVIDLTPKTPEVPPTPTPSPPPPPPPPVESSETESETSPDVTTASVSETVGREISEGEWLISKSEGQVDLIPDALEAQKMQFGNSADSTMMGTEEIERDMPETPSEGEIRPGKFGRINLTNDPVVALLARLGQPLHSSPITPPFRPPVAASNGERSPGEVSLGQRHSLTPSMERIIFDLAQSEAPAEGIGNDGMPSVRRRLSPGELGAKTSERINEEGVTQQVDDSTLRVSHLVKTNEQERSPSIVLGRQGNNSNVNEPPSNTNNNKVPAAVRPKISSAPQVVKVAVPRVIQVGGRSPTKSDRADDDEEEGEVREAETHKLNAAAGMTPVEDLPNDQKEDRNCARGTSMPTGSVFGTRTMSDLDTRTMTPDAINIDALLQSGYLNQTFSDVGTSDFEHTRTLGQTGDFPAGRSTGVTPFDMTQDSLEFPNNKMKPEKGPPRAFSVTLPSAQSIEDLGDSTSEGDIQPVDTISDVSEISAGDI